MPAPTTHERGLDDTHDASPYSNKDGIPGIPQDVASLQQRAANVALGGAEGVGVGDQALAKARAFLPSEQLEGMSRLAYSLELRVRA